MTKHQILIKIFSYQFSIFKIGRGGSLIFSLTVLAITFSSCNFSPESKIGAEAQQFTTEIVAQNLKIPWEIAFLPSGEMLVTERPGGLLIIGDDKKEIEIQGVHHQGEGGLLGLALHPNFSKNQFLYLYFTTATDNGLRTRVERYRFDNSELKDRTLIIDNIPGATYHDGGRIAFGPDGYLYITTGDAGESQLAQDKNSLAGKILRLRDDGTIPVDNPFGTAVYSWGHRNSQGITWDEQGQLWSTEHGRSGVQSGLDEVNLIEKGANYGWPVIEGDAVAPDMRAPVAHSGPSVTWAPASALYYKGSIWFTGLRGESLYQAKIASDGRSIESVLAHLQGKFGRLRALTLGPDGAFYLSTSNTDGRGKVREGDDKIIKVRMR